MPDRALRASVATFGYLSATRTQFSKPAIRVSEAEAPYDFPSLLERVRAGAEVVIERNAEA
jgi:hypothetical protein